MKANKILSAIGTYIVVGAASAAGAALWTNVLERKIRKAKERITKPKENNIIKFKKKMVKSR